MEDETKCLFVSTRGLAKSCDIHPVWNHLDQLSYPNFTTQNKYGITIYLHFDMVEQFINNLIDKMERGEQTTKVENEISRIFAATLDAEVKRNPTNENINAYERLIKAREKSSSEIGRALRSLQGVSNPLENISDFYVAKKEANKVDNLTDAQKAEVQKDFENIQKAKDEYETKWKEAEAKFAEMQAQSELLRQQKESGKKYIKGGKKDFVAERKDLKEKLKTEIQKYKNNAKKLGISSDGGADPEAHHRARPTVRDPPRMSPAPTPANAPDPAGPHPRHPPAATH
jgi:chemotaxis protein histidine kinase CheA